MDAMPQPIHSFRCPSVTTLVALLALGLALPHPLPASSPTAQALYRPAPPAAPVQILWNNGAPWSWDGARLDLQTYLGNAAVTLDPSPAGGKVQDGALHLSAGAACPRGCDAGVLRLVLPAPVDPGAYLKSGHLALEVKRIQPMRGSLVIGFGGLDPCGHASVRLEMLPQGHYRHLSLPLAGFTPGCAAGARMSVPFELSVKDARYPAGPLLALKFIRWTAD
jgi:hypothetical protein